MFYCLDWIQFSSEMGLKLELPMRRLIFALFSFLLIFMVCELLFIGELTTTDQENVYDYHDDWYESNSTMCDLPVRMDPYDPMIKNFIKKKSHKIVCIKSDDGAYDSLYNLHQGQSLSFMNDDDPIVRIFRIREREKSLKCLYQPFDRDGGDDEVKFLKKKPIIGHKLNLEKIGAEFVNIECYLDDKLAYTNIHSWPSRVPSQFDVTPLNISDVTKPSVMFLVIESMSLLNFKRFMVKTNKALSKLSNNFILRGLNKIADNSFPNMMPLLSGYRPYYGKWPFKFKVNKGPYDTIEFIWNDFNRKNYTTGYIEDFPKFGLFNYLASGFEKVPTDWYPRPYWLRMDKEQGIESRTFCYKHKPKIIHWLKQVKQFLNKVNKTKQPFFLWSFYIQVTHDDFNNAQLVDSYFADFINSYRHILENTVFVVMGDHGNRFGPSLRTEYGQIESRMPFFNIHIPPQLLQKHQTLAHYLKMNEKRLTTWLDVREMMKDVVSGTYEPIVSSSKRFAYSVWREVIPTDRTCQDALIPMEFCLCSKKRSFPIDSRLAQTASTAVVNKLNKALSEYKKLCHELSLKDIHNVQIIQSPGEPVSSNRVEVTLSVNPSNGLFQAQLYLKNSTKFFYSSIDDWILDGDISRLDSYGNQSSCINDRVHRKYCYCR